MGMPVEIADLPLNMNSGDYLGFVEGWTFSARYNQISVSLILSPIASHCKPCDGTMCRW
jgi:hypothetical protein